MTTRIRILGLPDDESQLSPGLAERFHAEVQKITQGKPGEDPPTRIGPDLVFTVLLDDGSTKRYELIAGGAYLRDPETRELWRCSLGKELLAEAIPRLIEAERIADEADRLAELKNPKKRKP